MLEVAGKVKIWLYQKVGVESVEL